MCPSDPQRSFASAQDDSEDEAQDDSVGGQCLRSFAALRMTMWTKLRMIVGRTVVRNAKY